MSANTTLTGGAASAPSGRPLPPGGIRFRDILLAAACLAVALALAWRWLSVVREQLAAARDLVYESPNLCTIWLLQNGQNIYSPAVYDDDPFVLTAYTPLYHYVVSLFPLDEANPFWAGRMVALAGIVGLAALLAIPGKDRVPLVQRCCLATCFLSIWAVTSNSAFLKSDSLGILLSASGMLLAWRRHSGTALAVAALFAVAAVATKQNMVACAAAVSIYLFAGDRRACVKYLLALALWSALAATWASLYFGDGFWFSIIQGQRQPFQYGDGIDVLQRGFAQPLGAALFISAAAAVLLRARRDGATAVVARSPCEAFFVLASLQLLATCWKVGSSTNYLIEPAWAACLVLMVDQRAVNGKSGWSRSGAVVAGALVASALLDLATARKVDYSFVDPTSKSASSDRAREYRTIVARSGATRPRILDLVSHWERFTVGRNVILNDPFTYGTLWEAGILPIEPLLASIDRENYDIIVVPDWYGYDSTLPAYHEGIRTVLLEHYRPFMQSQGLPKGIFFVRKPE